MITERKISARESCKHDLENASGVQRLIKNSIASAITGLSIALTSVVVPPVLARTLTPFEFGAWALVLQLAGYVSVLDLGIQGAVGRYVAYYLANQRRDMAANFASTALTILCFAALVGIGSLAAAGIFLHALFPQVPHALLRPARIALGLVGIGVSIGLPASAFRGVLTGVERYELVALVAAPTGLLLSLALIALALGGFGIVVLAVAFATVKLLSYVAYWRISRAFGKMSVRPALIDREMGRELWAYCSSTMIWSVGMLIVSGLDVAIVARLDFARLAAYAACVTPITIIAGAQTTVFRPLLQVGSRHFARGEMASVRGLLLRATRICVVSILLTVIPIFLFSHLILTYWLGKTYADQATLILRLMLVGQAIRLIATPYATLLLATNNHRITRFPAIAEALTNATSAVLLGIRFGADGVACGVIVGAVVGQLMNVLYNYPRTKDVVGQGRKLLIRAILIPAACFSPIASIPLVESLNVGEIGRISLELTASLASMFAIWKFAIEVNERRWLVEIFQRNFRIARRYQ